MSFHKGTLAPLGEYDWTYASFVPLESTTDTANGSVQSSLHSLRQKVPILYNGRPYPPELPLPIGDLDLPCNTWCFRPIRVHNPNGTSIGSAIFAQMTAELVSWSLTSLFSTNMAISETKMTAECLHNLQWFACFPSQLPLPVLASGPPLIHGSLGPPESRTQMATWSFQPFLQGWQSDRKTDRPRYSVRCGVIMRIYVGYGKASIVWLLIIYVIPVSHLKTGMQGRINIIISLNQKNI